MNEIASVNGKLSSIQDAVIPVLDRGFLFADDIFETLVGFHGQVLDIEEHLQRLSDSAARIDLSLPWRHEELAFELQHLASQTKLEKFAVRLVVTRGMGLGMIAPAQASPNKVVLLTKAQTPATSLLESGVKLQLEGSEHSASGPSAKTGNYLASILAIRRSQAAGFDEVLWTNRSGEVTEAATANIFFLAREGDGVWFVTPSLDCGILSGITRAQIIDLLRKAQIRVEERAIAVEELPRFDEAFLTSTVRGLIPVQRIDGHRLHTTRPSAVFKHIERLYQTSVNIKLGFKVDWHSGRQLGEL